MFGNCFRNRCPVSGHRLRNEAADIFILHCCGRFCGSCLKLPLPMCKSLECFALGLLGLPRGYFCNEQIIGIHCSGANGATSGAPLLSGNACGHPFRNRCPVSGHLLRNPQSNIFIAHCFGCCMCLATHSVTGARFPGTCYGMSQLTFSYFIVADVFAVPV